jgi:hypothetical protein
MDYQPYPKLLYIDRSTYKAAANEEEHDALLAQGYVAFADLPPPDPDGLDLLSDDQLRAKLLDMAKALFASRPRSELIFQIRFQMDAAAREKAAAEAPPMPEPEPVELPEETENTIIYGSATHPETVTINGQDLDIGPIVRSAFVDSGMTTAEWNAAASNDRDALIQLTIDRLAEAEPETVIEELSADGADPTPRADEAEAKVQPLDHDGDGEKGGAPKVSEAVLKLRADLDALGVKYDKRWREERLTQALDEATKA